jgi:hypothetical protein
MKLLFQNIIWTMPLSVIYSIIQMAASGFFTDLDSEEVIFDDFSAHLRQYFGNNSTNVIFQMFKSLWIIRIDTVFSITSQKSSKCASSLKKI